MADALVIGAGIGGLAAAIALGAAGKRVLVLEAADRPGGKAGVATIDGVEVDTGPSVLTLPHVFDELLALAGMRLHDEVRLSAPSPSFRYLYPDGVVLDVHPDLGRTLDGVREALDLRAASELERFLDYTERIWRAAAPAFVLGDAPSVGRLFAGGLGTLAALAHIDPLRSMRQAIRARVRSPHLRSLLLRYATYNGSDARRAPATLSCIAHVELALGGFGVEGGMHELVRALVRAVTRLGGEIRCESPVRSIELAAGRVRGVVLANGEQLRSELVVANAEASFVAEALLPPGTRHGICLDEPRSMSGYTAIVKAERREAPRVAHTVLFPDDYEAEHADIFDRERPPEEPTVYLCAEEACHRRRGWKAHEPVFVMANAPAEPRAGARDEAAWHALRERVMGRLIEAGLVASDDAIVWERTPRDLAERFPGSRGALYGAASNGRAAAFRRPPNALPAVRGLFLASGSAHPGGGMPLAALSGRAAARAALGRSEAAEPRGARAVTAFDTLTRT